MIHNIIKPINCILYKDHQLLDGGLRTHFLRILMAVKINDHGYLRKKMFFVSVFISRFIYICNKTIAILQINPDTSFKIFVIFNILKEALKVF